MRRVPFSVSEVRTCSSGYLFFILLKHLLQLHALTPARTIANLCRPRSTKFFAQDLLLGLSHLRLEPQCDSSGILLGAFQEHLVVAHEDHHSLRTLASAFPQESQRQTDRSL